MFATVFIVSKLVNCPLGTPETETIPRKSTDAAASPVA